MQDLANGRASERVTYKHIATRAGTVCKYESKMQNVIILQGRYEQHVRQLGDEKSVGRCDESNGWYRSGGTNNVGSGSIKRSGCETTDIREGVHAQILCGILCASGLGVSTRRRMTVKWGVRLSISNNVSLSFWYPSFLSRRPSSSSFGLCCVRYSNPRSNCPRTWSSRWIRSARRCPIPIPPKSSRIEVHISSRPSGVSHSDQTRSKYDVRISMSLSPRTTLTTRA